MKKIAVIVAKNGFEEIETVTIVDLLRRAGLDVYLVSKEKNEIITGDHNISMISDLTLSEIDESFEAIIFPGGLIQANTLKKDKEILKLINIFYEKNKLVAAICASPMILFESGILKNKEFTCYPGIENEISDGKYLDKNTIITSNVLTGKGPALSIDFTLEVIKYILGEASYNQIKKEILY